MSVTINDDPKTQIAQGLRGLPNSAISFHIEERPAGFRASSPCTGALVAGSCRAIPGRRKRNRRRRAPEIPRSGWVLMAPSGASVFTPLGEDELGDRCRRAAEDTAHALLRPCVLLHLPFGNRARGRAPRPQ